MPINPLSIFYSVPVRWELDSFGRVHWLWKCDRAAMRGICQAGNFDLAEIPLVDLHQVNIYVDRLLVANPELITVAIDSLYKVALSSPPAPHHNCWFNFITSMTVKAAQHTWNKIPRSQQSEELFERLITPTVGIQQLLTGFNPKYHPNLLVGLQAWTYQVVKYNSYADLRANGHPYFGLSNLGIVSRSSYKLIRTALLGNIIPTQFESYVSISKVFKNYLARSGLSVNKLRSDDWQAILVELHSFSINITVEELQGIVDRVGTLIRADRSPIIEKYDDRDRSIPIDRYVSPPPPDFEESQQLFGQLLMLIDGFINSLPVETQQIVKLRHHQRLTQTDIAKIVPRDQSAISRLLGKVYLKLLDLIYSQVPHPDSGEPQKNSQSIEATTKLLEHYFRR
ncbi:MAG: hypothetical protein LH613_10055, partial [Chamaesiphon sp.]|nr:hypothetical protein [Chamaesiphon sp.]